ncbi:MAG: hypothetical protein ACRC5U_07980 [Plesiomonas sp.]
MHKVTIDPFYLLFLTLLIPGAILSVSISSSSFVSILFCGVIIFIFAICMESKPKINSKYFLFMVVIPILILIHYLLTLFLNNENYLEGDLYRTVFSIVLMSFNMFTLSILFHWLRRVNNELIVKRLTGFYWFLIIFSFLYCLAYVAGFTSIKRMFLFYEPSHFSLVFTPFVMFRFLSKKIKVYEYIILFILGIAIENLVYFVALFFAIFIGLRLTILKHCLVLLCIFLLSFIFFHYEIYDFLPNYYSQRFNLNANSQNLTVLVFLSGVERAYLSLIDSGLIGYGFQQMGLIGPTGSIQDSLSKLNAPNLNISDGGFLLSKIIFEFGMFGFVLFFLYLRFYLYQVKNILCSQEYFNVFCSCCYISFAIYLVFRGSGYFMPSVSLFFISLNEFISKNKNHSSF